jgi:alpha-ketoglutarate-dependent taurine dioxygenase
MLLDSRELERDGYTFMRNVSETNLAQLAQKLGPIRVDPRSPVPVRDIRPQPVHSAKNNTLSSRYGTGAFPFHTDTAHWDRPARFLALYCVDPGEGKRSTILQDTRLWRLDYAENELACRALWKTGHVGPRLCTIAEGTHGEVFIRYDMDCMRPMTKEAREVKTFVEARISSTPTIQIDWQTECLLVLDNYRMLHARGTSIAPDTSRIHKRILIGGA